MSEGRALRLVAVCGSLGERSKTRALLGALADGLADRIDSEVGLVDLAVLAAGLAGTTTREVAPPMVAEALEQIETADVLIVASPVYRAAFSGLFKHVFDLVDQHALEGVPVLLAATGGSERHSLILEHHLRPLFAFFHAVTLPVGVYGTDADFEDGVIASDALRERVDRAVDRAVPLIRHLHPQARPAVVAAPRTRGPVG